MAPVCMAGHLLPGFFVFYLFVSFLFQDVAAILVYDRLMLINIRNSVELLGQQELRGLGSYLPPDLSSVPAALHRLPCGLPLKKRRRRRGK